MKYGKKTYWGVGIGVVAAVLIGVFYWYEVKEFQERQGVGAGQEAFYEQMEQERERLVDAYKNDTDGGETPQETWDMFITALEAGDTEQASKYFIVEKQEEMKKQFEAGKKNGALETFLTEDIPQIKGGDYHEDGKTFEFYTGSIEGGPGYVYLLVLNEYTDVWKIESL